MDLDGVSGFELISAFTGLGSVNPQRKELIASLPALSEHDLISLDQKDSCCPICFTPFLAVLASEEMALAMESPALSVEDLGVTRLAKTCGHLFCRKDITTWIRQHDTCPTCRQPFITLPARPANVPQNTAVNQENRDTNIELDMLLSSFAPSEEELESRERLTRLVAQLQQIPTTEEPAHGVGRANEHNDLTRHRIDDDREEFVGMYS